MNAKITTSKIIGTNEYSATLPHGHQHSLHAQGWGRTRAAAIADLKRQIREYEDMAASEPREIDYLGVIR